MKEIPSFKIRGAYPNQRSLFHSVEKRLSRKEEAAGRLPGYSPPVVEFEEGHGGGRSAGEIAVRDVDLPLLCQPDSEKAKGHLGLILAAREGDQKADGELAEAIRRQYRSMDGGFKSLDLVEDRFVVPSLTGQAYAEDAISHKGAILLKLSQLGYPVPDFSILSSHVYRDGAEALARHIGDALGNLEKLTSQGVGSLDDPLVFAVRCAMPSYIPGVMPTYLNVGMTEGTATTLRRIIGAHAADKAFLNNLKNLYAEIDPERYRGVAGRVRSDLSPQETARCVDFLAEAVRAHDRRLVEDPFRQARFLIERAYRYYEDNLDLLTTLSKGKGQFPSVILQKMICTVRGEEAYAGVLFSRNPMTGEGPFLESAHNVFGEEIMTGILEAKKTSFADREEVRASFPGIHHFVPRLQELEKEFEAPVTVEFAVEATRRYQLFALLQLDITGMTGRAAFVSLVDLHKAGRVSTRRAMELICPYHVRQVEGDTIDSGSFKSLERFSSGVNILPRAAVCARVYFGAQAALAAKKGGENVCFCKGAFQPEDTVVIREMDAIVSLAPASIHVVTTCQSFGVPALLNLERDGVRLEADRLANASGAEIREGDWVTISSRRKTLYRGKALFKPARLVRYLGGEQVELDEEEKRPFADMAYAYRYYQALVRSLKLDEVASFNDLARLVACGFREDPDKGAQLVNLWYDGNDELFVEEIFRAELGDHLKQHSVFNMLTLDRKLRFFKKAAARCVRDGTFGYTAGTFMLGRFLGLRQPVAFWRSFSGSETALLVNEWLLFQKYMSVLSAIGERKVSRVRSRILTAGLGDLSLGLCDVKELVPLKLSGADLGRVAGEAPAWADPQCREVLELLARPYRDLYDFSSPWSLRELETICAEENLPLPGPDQA